MFENGESKWHAGKNGSDTSKEIRLGRSTLTDPPFIIGLYLRYRQGVAILAANIWANLQRHLKGLIGNRTELIVADQQGRALGAGAWRQRSPRRRLE